MEVVENTSIVKGYIELLKKHLRHFSQTKQPKNLLQKLEIVE